MSKETVPFITALRSLQREKHQREQAAGTAPAGAPWETQAQGIWELLEGHTGSCWGPGVLLCLGVLPPSVRHRSKVTWYHPETAYLLTLPWGLLGIHRGGSGPGGPADTTRSLPPCHLRKVLGTESWLWLQSSETLFSPQLPMLQRH